MLNKSVCVCVCVYDGWSPNEWEWEKQESLGVLQQQNLIVVLNSQSAD